MAELIQDGGKFDISVRLDNDLSFTVTCGFDLTLFDYYAYIVPMTTGSTEIAISITPIDLTIGKLHFFISKESIKDIPISKEKSRWYFNINNPKQEIPEIVVYTRAILEGYFSVIGK